MVLCDGDIFNIDIMVIKDGYYGDILKMFLIGDVLIEDKCLCYVV